MKHAGIDLQLADWIPDEAIAQMVGMIVEHPSFREIVEECLHLAIDRSEPIGEALVAQVRIDGPSEI